MYRPEGWRTPNVVALKEIKAGFVMADQVSFLTEKECKAFEAGADAMLEALRKRALKKDASEVDIMYFLFTQGGQLVFIPEEDKIE